MCLDPVYPPGGNSNELSQGARPKNSQRHRFCTHILTYNLDYVWKNLDYVSNSLQLSIGVVTPLSSHSQSSENGDVARSP